MSKLYDYNVTSSMPSLGLLDYNITSTNGWKKCKHCCHGLGYCEIEHKQLSAKKNCNHENDDVKMSE